MHVIEIIKPIQLQLLTEKNALYYNLCVLHRFALNGELVDLNFSPKFKNKIRNLFSQSVCKIVFMNKRIFKVPNMVLGLSVLSYTGKLKLQKYVINTFTNSGQKGGTCLFFKANSCESFIRYTRVFLIYIKMLQVVRNIFSYLD